MTEPMERPILRNPRSRQKHYQGRSPDTNTANKFKKKSLTDEERQHREDLAAMKAKQSRQPKPDKSRGGSSKRRHC